METELTIDIAFSDTEALSLEETFNEGLNVLQTKFETLSEKNLTLLRKNLAELPT